MLYSEYFLHSGFIFEVKAYINDRTEEPEFTQSLWVDGECVGQSEGRFIAAMEWLRDNFYRYI